MEKNTKMIKSELSFEKVYNFLRHNYQMVEEKRNTYYFIDENNKVVAILNGRKIVMYFKANDAIYSHCDRVAVGVVKNFNVNGIRADIMFVDGLTGTVNDYEVYRNSGIDSDVNWDLEEERLGSISDVQKKEQENGSKYLISMGDYLVSFKDEKTIGIDNFCSELNILLLKSRGSGVVDYQVLYEYMRNKNDWCYNSGYDTAGSEEKREYINSRKYKTVDNVERPFVKKRVKINK